MLDALAALVVRRPRSIVALVLVLAAVCAAFLGDVLPRLSGGGLADPGAESWRVRGEIERLGQGDADVIAVVHVRGGTVDEPEATGALVAAVDRLERDPAVRAVLDDVVHGAAFLTSTDRTTTAIVVTLKGADRDRLAALPRIERELGLDDDARAAGLSVSFTGFQPVNAETTRIVTHDLVRGEAVALPLTLLFLVWIFGSIASAAVPVALGALATVFALSLLGALTRVVDVSVFAANIVTLLSIGLAVDASLFLVTRFREELADPARTVDDAVYIAMKTAGRAVLFSGLAVALGLCGLLLFPQMLLRSLGIAGIASVVATNALVLTFVPAVLRLAGRNVERGRIRGARSVPVDDTALARTFFWRLAVTVMRRPALVLVVVSGTLVVTALPFSRFVPSALDWRSLPPDTPLSLATADLYRTVAPGLMTPHEILVHFHDDEANDVGGETGGALGPRRLARAFAVYQALAHVDGVARVISVFSLAPGVAPEKMRDALLARNGAFTDEERARAAPLVGARGSASDPVMRFLALDDASYNAPSAMETVRALRRLHVDGVDIEVGGASAGLVDLVDGVRERAPFVVGLVCGAMFLVLAFAFRSVVIPLKALVLTGLSITASFGALVFVFQDGRFTELLRYRATGLSDAPQPIFLFCLVFGLSMDYEVILLARVQEEAAKAPLDVAVARGLARTGRLFTSAAALFVLVVAAFASSEILTIKELGFGMALAVILDATVVRALLVPAALALFGRANWWPGPLSRRR